MCPETKVTSYRSGSGIRLSFETPIESHEIVWWRYELGIQ